MKGVFLNISLAIYVCKLTFLYTTRQPDCLVHDLFHKQELLQLICCQNLLFENGMDLTKYLGQFENVKCMKHRLVLNYPPLY